jgi:hypothetical protein
MNIPPRVFFGGSTIVEQSFGREQINFGFRCKLAGSGWARLWPGSVLMLAIAFQGCAPGSGNTLTGSGWTQSEINALASPVQADCDSDQDVLPPMDDPKPQDLANEITRYLNEHCLPLVRASATKSGNGDPEIMLYGFVPSDSARQQAEARTDQLIAFSGIPLKDAIMVRPELASATADHKAANPLNSADSDAAAQQMMIQQYRNQDQNGTLTIPLASGLMGAGIIGGTIGGGSGMLVAPGPGPYPFGYAAPNPYYPTGLGAGFTGGSRPVP